MKVGVLFERIKIAIGVIANGKLIVEHQNAIEQKAKAEQNLIEASNLFGSTIEKIIGEKREVLVTNANMHNRSCITKAVPIFNKDKIPWIETHTPFMGTLYTQKTMNLQEVQVNITCCEDINKIADIASIEFAKKLMEMGLFKMSRQRNPHPTSFMDEYMTQFTMGIYVEK